MDYVIGLDISTSCCGVTILDTLGRFYSLDNVKLTSTKIKTIMQKADKVAEFLKNIDVKIVDILIEEPLKNSPNINTVLTLAKFNGIVSRDCYSIFGVEPTYYSVHELRKTFLPEYVTRKGTLSIPTNLDKKIVIFNKVKNLIPHYEWEYDKNNKIKKEELDKSDSYCVAFAGMKMKGYPINIF